MSKIYIPVAIQRAVLELSRDYCEYCVIPSNFSTDYFHYEHIIALALNGPTELGNIARSCGICNNNKRDKIEHIDPLTQEIVRQKMRKALKTYSFQGFSFRGQFEQRLSFAANRLDSGLLHQYVYRANRR